MPFTIPTLDRMHEFVIAVMRALLPAKNWSRFAPGWKWFRGVSLAATELHAHIANRIKDLLPDSASEEYLARWAAFVNVPRKAATAARKANALRVVGEATTPVTAGLELTHEPTGLRYIVNESDVIGAGGYVDVDVLALDVGRQTQLAKGETLRFLAPPTGISEEAALVLDIDEHGDDREQLGAWRTRILDRFANPPRGGAQNDYVQWSLEITGVESAYAYPGRGGKGTVDVAALHTGSGTQRLLSSGERAELLAYLRTKAPANVDTALRVLEVQVLPVDVEVLYTPWPGSAYAPEWDDTTPPTVTAWDAPTRKVTLSARPSSLEAGDRLVFRDVSTTPADDGRQYTVEALSGTLDVILEETPTFTPAVGDVVYSGGPLVDTLRNAIIGHIDTLGPSNPDVKSYGSWEANLRPENLYALTQLIAGVRKSTVVTPATTVEPPDNEWPTDSIVYLLAPRRVLVRRG